MENYQPRFYSMLNKVDIDRAQLGVSLKNLIEKFENATVILNDRKEQPSLFNILAQTDAVICAALFQQYKVLLEKTHDTNTVYPEIDKIKIIAMRAKALQLKWKMKQRVNQ